MNKRAILIFLSLLFYSLLTIFTWHAHWQAKSNIPTQLTVLFFSLFIVSLFIFQHRFFNQKRCVLSCLLWGSLSGLILGALCWYIAIFCFDDSRQALINGWQHESNLLNFITWRIFVSAVLTGNVVIGAISCVTAHFFVNK